MTEQLALKYRPRRFPDVVGQRQVAAVLFRMCQRRRVPPGILLTGQFGSGKTSTARIIAMALNCEEPPGPAGSWPCGSCASCKLIEAGQNLHPAVEELDAASHGTVEQIRAVRERAYYGAGGSGHRLFVIDEAHRLSDAAFDAMLTILESPPPGVVFILCTTRPEAVPATVRSRMSPFSFRPITVPVIRDRLAHICQQEGIKAEPELLAAIAEGARGAMRDAVVQLDQLSSVGVSTLSMWHELTGETDFAPGLLAAAADGDHAAMYALMDTALGVYGDPGQVQDKLVGLLKELLVLASGGSVLAQGERLAARRALIDRLGAGRVSGAMQALWDLETRVRAGDRARGLELALSVISRRLVPPPSSGPAASVAEIAELMGTTA